MLRMALKNKYPDEMVHPSDFQYVKFHHLIEEELKNIIGRKCGFRVTSEPKPTSKHTICVHHDPPLFILL